MDESFIIKDVMLYLMQNMNFMNALRTSCTCQTLYKSWPLYVTELPIPIEAIITFKALRKFTNLISINLKYNKILTTMKSVEFPQLKIFSARNIRNPLAPLALLIAPNLEEANVLTLESIPSKFPKLVSLGCNEFTVTGGNSITRLTRLHVLKVNNISKLSSAVNLKSLSLSGVGNMRLSKICVLTTLTNLTQLDIHCFISSRHDLSGILTLPNLRVLHAPNFKVPANISASTTLRSLGCATLNMQQTWLTNLKDLTFREYDLFIVNGIGCLTQLTSLSSVAPSNLHEFTNLKKLQIRATSIVSDHVWICLTKLRDLTVNFKYLKNNLTSLVHLKSLQITSGMWVGNLDDLAPLTNLTNLRWPAPVESTKIERLPFLTNLKRLTVPRVTLEFRKRYQTRMLIVETINKPIKNE